MIPVRTTSHGYFQVASKFYNISGVNLYDYYSGQYNGTYSSIRKSGECELRGN